MSKSEPLLNPQTLARKMNVIFFIQLGLVIGMIVLYIIDSLLIFNVGSFLFAILLGALGATISLIRRLRKPGPQKEVVTTNPYLGTMMPILYGTLLSGVAYLLFMSGILSGDGGGGLFTTNLFPNFNTEVLYEGGDPNKPKDLPLLEQFRLLNPITVRETGKLLVWCFLAGYSERFITGILEQLERSNA